jgi:UDP-glucose 4-epimerase
MNPLRTVLVTGVAGYWGQRLATRLLAEPELRVIGLDTEPPAKPIEGLDFIAADIRNPLLAELLETEGVETICHLAFRESIQPSESNFDFNVMGTMKLLGACVQAGVRKAVIMGSTMVYGAQANNSAFLSEDHHLHGTRSYGYIRDMVEREPLYQNTRRHVPQLALTVLRLPNVLGPTVDSPLVRFLRDNRTPVLLGFDPMMQIIHEDDVVEALAHAVINDVPGIFNIAADKPMPLWQLMSLVGKIPIPLAHPLAYFGVSLVGNRYTPLPLDYLRYPWVGDIRKMQAEFGFEPSHTTDETVREFAQYRRMSQYLPETVPAGQAPEELREVIERRREMRQQATDTSDEDGSNTNGYQ